MTDERSNAVLYGKGVFTTVAIRDGLPLLWQKHWVRLCRDAERLNIDLSAITEATVLADVTDALAAAGISAGRARITITDKTSAALWMSEDAKSTTDVSVIVGSQHKTPQPFRITTSPHIVNSTSPLAGVKSCNYLEPLMSHEEVTGRGFHEAVRLNERGHVTSVCMANVFWVSGNELRTPALSTGCLPGTTREFVLENIECSEVEAGIDELRQADAIYLTSAGLGIISVDEFDGRKLTRRDHPILRLWPPA